MDVPTRSSSRAPNARARLSLLLGLVAAAAFPAAVTIAYEAEPVEYVESVLAAIPVAAVFGVGAVLLARGARRRIERTLGRLGGDRSARAGRVLGALGLCAAVSGAIAVGVYAYLINT